MIQPVPVLAQLASTASTFPSKLTLVEAKLQALVNSAKAGLPASQHKPLDDQHVTIKSTLEALKKLSSSVQAGANALVTFNAEQKNVVES